MNYTIKDVAKILNLTPTTIRYYDKEGLLPFVQRLKSGYRIFSDNDIAMLKIIECLKHTGMSIKDLRQFSIWVQEGDSTLKNRYEFFKEREKVVKEQINSMEKTLELIKYKQQYYKNALDAGTQNIDLHNLADTIDNNNNFF